MKCVGCLLSPTTSGSALHPSPPISGPLEADPDGFHQWEFLIASTCPPVRATVTVGWPCLVAAATLS